MRIRILERKRLCALAVALAALLLAIACTPPATPTGQKVVRIGLLQCLTGGGASADQPAFQSEIDYIRYFNEEESIPGVTIEAVWRDTQTSDQLLLSQYRGFIEAGLPLIYSTLTFEGGMKPLVEKDRTPMLTGTVTGIVVYPPGWLFGATATQGEQIAGLLDYFMENWKEQRPPKLQIISIDIATFGRESSEEATKYAESIGFEVLPLEIVPLVVIDAGVQLLRVRERQPDLVYIQHVITGVWPILRDAERLGLHNQMQFAGPEFVMSEQLIKAAPAGAEGFLAPKFLPPIDDTEIPGVKTLHGVAMKYHGAVNRDPATMSGWAYMAILCEAVKRAGEELGYDNIDGPAAKRALESMQDFDAAGIVKVTYGPEDRRGFTRIAVHQIQGGKIVRVSDYREVPILTP